MKQTNKREGESILNPVIVIVAYNREKSVRRLLNTLEKAKYDGSVTLIISIDFGDNQNVVDTANNFVWSHGEKIIRTFSENLGCCAHVMKCIDYCIEYGAAIIFEDDILPSMNFYSYVTQTLQAYSDNEDIFAIALHNQAWNGFADELFVPIRNEADVYIAQRVCSRGECFIGEKWKEFKEWYAKKAGRLQTRDDLPQVIYQWNESWGKYVWDYIAERRLFYVTPYDSLTTCFPDAGVHYQDEGIKYKLQVPLSNGKEFYNLPDISETVKYDAFFESIDLKHYIEQQYGKRVVIDYYGSRDSYADAQLCLTRKALPYKVLKKYSDEMIQSELNYIYDIQGEDIILYDLEQPAEINKKGENRNSIYFGNELNQERENTAKCMENMKTFNKWVNVLHEGKVIADYLKKNQIQTVAIYGMGILGERLLDELIISEVNVVCGIDRNLRKKYKNLIMRSPDDTFQDVQCIIVTAVFYYTDIKSNLEQRTTARVVSLQEILDEITKY